MPASVRATYYRGVMTPEYWIEEWGENWPVCPRCKAEFNMPCIDLRVKMEPVRYTYKPHPQRPAPPWWPTSKES